MIQFCALYQNLIIARETNYSVKVSQSTIYSLNGMMFSKLAKHFQPMLIQAYNMIQLTEQLFFLSEHGELLCCSSAFEI